MQPFSMKGDEEVTLGFLLKRQVYVTFFFLFLYCLSFVLIYRLCTIFFFQHRL
jgi:hypothetical protein